MMRYLGLQLSLILLSGAFAGCGTGVEMELLFRGRTEGGDQFAIARKFHHKVVLGERRVSKSLVLMTEGFPEGLVTLVAEDTTYGGEFQVRSQGRKAWLISRADEAPVAAVDFESHRVHPAGENQPAWATSGAGRVVEDESRIVPVEHAAESRH